MKKKAGNQEALRKRVYAFLDLHPNYKKSWVVNHFRSENIPKSTMYSILSRKENNIGPERKVGSGRKAKKMPTKQIKRLEKSIDHKDGISQRGLAKRFNVSQQYISHLIKTKTNIRYRKKSKAPKRTTAQIAALRPKCRKLASIFRKKYVIIDDESYFYLSNTGLSQNAGYYSSNVDQTENEVKLKRKTKFEPKLLVWIAFSQKGVSKYYIVPSGQAIDENVYISKCLTKLESFIQDFHESDDIVFWPDLASSHYSKKVQDYLKSKKIEFVPKEHNPANVPELRPIEDFWSELKRLVYDNNWKCDDLAKLKNRIEYSIKKIDPKRVHRLGASTFTRVDRVRRKGMKNI